MSLYAHIHVADPQHTPTPVNTPQNTPTSVHTDSTISSSHWTGSEYPRNIFCATNYGCRSHNCNKRPKPQKKPNQQTITQFQHLLARTRQNKTRFRNCNRNSHCGCCFESKETTAKKVISKFIFAVHKLLKRVLS